MHEFFGFFARRACVREAKNEVFGGGAGFGGGEPVPASQIFGFFVGGAGFGWFEHASAR